MNYLKNLPANWTPVSCLAGHQIVPNEGENYAVDLFFLFRLSPSGAVDNNQIHAEYRPAMFNDIYLPSRNPDKTPFECFVHGLKALVRLEVKEVSLDLCYDSDLFVRCVDRVKLQVACVASLSFRSGAFAYSLDSLPSRFVSVDGRQLLGGVHPSGVTHLGDKCFNLGRDGTDATVVVGEIGDDFIQVLTEESAPVFEKLRIAASQPSA